MEQACLQADQSMETYGERVHITWRLMYSMRGNEEDDCCRVFRTSFLEFNQSNFELTPQISSRMHDWKLINPWTKGNFQT